MTREEREGLKRLIKKLTEQKEEFQQMSVRGRSVMSRNVARGQYDILVTTISQIKQLLPQEYDKDKEYVIKMQNIIGRRMINTPVSIVYNYATEDYKIVAFHNSEKEYVVFVSNAIVGAWSYQTTMRTTLFKGSSDLISKRAYDNLKHRFPETTAKAMDIKALIKELGKWIAENIAYKGKVVSKND